MPNCTPQSSTGSRITDAPRIFNREVGILCKKYKLSKKTHLLFTPIFNYGVGAENVSINRRMMYLPTWHSLQNIG